MCSARVYVPSKWKVADQVLFVFVGPGGKKGKERNERKGLFPLLGEIFSRNITTQSCWGMHGLRTQLQYPIFHLSNLLTVRTRFRAGALALERTNDILEKKTYTMFVGWMTRYGWSGRWETIPSLFTSKLNVKEQAKVQKSTTRGKGGGHSTLVSPGAFTSLAYYTAYIGKITRNRAQGGCLYNLLSLSAT